MENIEKILSDMGLSLTDEQKATLKTKMEANYKTVNDYNKQKEKLEAAAEAQKTNDEAIADLKKQLEGFKDVDVSALNTRIKELEEEKQKQETEFNTKLADRDFNDMLKENIASAKGKNAKAIAALLDMDALKASKNQKDDITAALKTLAEAEDSKMLFGEPEAEVVGMGNLIGQVTKTQGDTADAQMRAVMGLPPLTGGNE